MFIYYNKSPIINIMNLLSFLAVFEKYKNTKKTQRDNRNPALGIAGTWSSLAV